MLKGISLFSGMGGDTLGMIKAGIEVIYDDRDAKAGFAFNDADLIGVPYRVVVSPKTLDQDSVEFKTRDGSIKEMIAADSAVDYLKKLITEKLSEI